ncbi:glycosyltransferase family 2 protein [Pedobacter psychrodurus]|uniref:glycosyltransferase family 2 protein n=1 Tax=Pedobacter psychrodurus TaxID=2530456 RepID=UPI00292F43A3|nr:glycosyltransferase family 2 protein [Pedobacter psychrodurus]
MANTSYKAISVGDPEVSVVIPAFNEEDNILPTLASLAANKTKRVVEIIVVNNNSTDGTETLVRNTGVKCILENRQGITFARNSGLAVAKGKYILNADADTIYPADWIEQMTAPLEDKGISLTYGRFAFLPIAETGRRTYFLYEHLARFSRWINKIFKDEAVNVYGFNSGFRREQGIAVEGFDHPQGTNEDGWLALKLRDKGFGKLHLVTDIRALTWTTDRRIQIDGGLIKGSLKRISRVLGG